MHNKINPDIDYATFMAQLRDEFGVEYSFAQLNEPDFVIKEMARLGYAITINHITIDYAKHMFNRAPDYPPGCNAMYSYRIWGSQQLDSHASFLFTSLIQCVLTAFYNVLRLEHAAIKKEKLS